ncbi:hypothetical protein [Desulfopila aestuarii]|uniref:Uncharacterized protein n=1 Tax=Desulfopila aestuarii DSM 18488 TaxID=1121416 RepID=A0A1M7YJL9_9BACT|nr:hypothetical protein [Desulfopila aestuarii]SHO52766.1 hypothetical protein SAMN02745220_04738 [Desulfopila aestuarii DSM 18488]
MLNYKEKIDAVSRLTIYAKVLFDKEDYLRASLVGCKVHDLLALADHEKRELSATDNDYIALKKSKLRELHASENIQFVVCKCLSKTGDNKETQDTLKAIFDGNDYDQHSGKISSLRNNLIHNHTDFASSAFKADCGDLVSRLFALPFVQNALHSKYGGNISCNYEVERKILAELGIQSKNEKPLFTPDYVITHDIFEDLIQTRKTVFPVLKQELSESIKSEYLDLNDVQISNVDSTSAYVWLSIPLKSSTLPEKIRIRSKLHLPTLSIALTPAGIWVYVEFGGLSYPYKVAYYEYLLNESNFCEFLESVNRSNVDQDIPNSKKIRNVHWYVFENNSINLSEINFDEIGNFHQHFSLMLKKWLNDKESLFCKAVEKNKPLSWNIALTGWEYPHTSFITGTHITLRQFATRVRKHIDAFEPLLKYLINLRKPLKKSNKIICNEYRKLLR